jgi:hypothetical protein
MTTIVSELNASRGGSVTIEKEQDYSSAAVYFQTDYNGASFTKGDAKKVIQAIAEVAGFTVKIGD